MQKVAVLGFGLNGLILSIAAHVAGFDVEIYEGGDLQSYTKDLRTSVLTYETLCFLKQFGMYEEILLKSAPINHIYVFEGEESPVLGFDKSGENPFGVVIHNFNLKEILIKKIHSLGLTIYNKKIEDITQNESFAEIENKKYKLVFDCTGKQGKQDIISFDYNQTAFVFNILHTVEHKNIAVESFNPQGPLAILPMQDACNSAVIWSVKNDSANFLSALKEEDFLEIFKSYLGRMGHIGEVLKIVSIIKSYPLSLTFDKNIFNGRVVKIGDALNSIHPVAGQAFNMSIKDIRNFYNELAEAKKLGIDIGGQEFLKSIVRKNILHHAEMNAFTHILVRAFSNSNNLLQVGRNATLHVLEKAPFIKNFLIKKASGKSD